MRDSFIKDYHQVKDKTREELALAVLPYKQDRWRVYASQVKGYYIVTSNNVEIKVTDSAYDAIQYVKQLSKRKLVIGL